MHDLKLILKTTSNPMKCLSRGRCIQKSIHSVKFLVMVFLLRILDCSAVAQCSSKGLYNVLCSAKEIITATKRKHRAGEAALELTLQDEHVLITKHQSFSLQLFCCLLDLLTDPPHSKSFSLRPTFAKDACNCTCFAFKDSLMHAHKHIGRKQWLLKLGFLPLENAPFRNFSIKRSLGILCFDCWLG